MSPVAQPGFTGLERLYIYMEEGMPVNGHPSGWFCTAVERRSLAGELSLSCARPVADG